MKLAVAAAALPLLAAAAPTLEQPQQEKRTLGLILGLLFGGNRGGWSSGTQVGQCSAGNVWWAGHYNDQDYFRWGQSEHPAPIAVCRQETYSLIKREEHEAHEKRTLGLLLGVTSALIGFKIKLVEGIVGTIVNPIWGSSCFQWDQPEFVWQGLHYYHGYRNWRGEWVYQCQEDGHHYIFVPCKGEEDTDHPIGDNGCCNACGGCDEKRSINDLE